ncbi:Enolase-phosphatase E1, partial [Cladochytrium tenue]
GTTTPISFVHDVLFPYVLTNLDAFLARVGSDSVLDAIVDSIRQQAAKDAGDSSLPPGLPAVLPSDTPDRAALAASVAANIRWQMAFDRKIAPLKDLQGYMWRTAYQSGEVKATVYPDVVDALRRWRDLGVPVYVYSSGSVPAQKLLFGYSDHGDLLEYFQGYFDTTTGSKLEAESYRRIAAATGANPADVLFLSDNVKEIDAAAAAGLSVAIVWRTGNAQLEPAATGAVGSQQQARGGSGATVPVVYSFDELFARTADFSVASSAAAAK